MYAIIELQGHQYIVQKGDTITVDRVQEEKEVKIDTVLAVFDDKGTDVKLGTPFVKATVTATVKENKKGEKVHVLKFKRKNRYERNIWFSPHQTVLEIKEIKLNG